MKKTVFLSLLAIMLVFGIVVVGCDNNTTNGNKNDNDEYLIFNITGFTSESNCKITLIRFYLTIPAASIGYNVDSTIDSNGNVTVKFPVDRFIGSHSSEYYYVFEVKDNDEDGNPRYYRTIQKYPFGNNTYSLSFSDDLIKTLG